MARTGFKMRTLHFSHAILGGMLLWVSIPAHAALQVLMAADGIQPVFDKALAAASRRSKELAG